MRFACQSCGKAYNLPEERIAEKSNVKLKCRVCGSIVEVKKHGEVVAQLLEDVDLNRAGRLSEAPAPLVTVGDDEPDEATAAIALNEDGLPMMAPPGTGFANVSLPLPPPPIPRGEPVVREGAVLPLGASPLAVGGASGSLGLSAPLNVALPSPPPAAFSAPLLSPPPLTGGPLGASTGAAPLGGALGNLGASPLMPPLPGALDGAADGASSSGASLNGAGTPLPLSDVFRAVETDVAPGASPTTGAYVGGPFVDGADPSQSFAPVGSTPAAGGYALSIVLAAFATGVLVGVIVTLLFL